MSSVYNSLKTAIATYSIFPIKKIKWESEYTKYSIGLFPIVGVIIAALLYGWNYVCVNYNINNMVCAVVTLLIMFIHTGGIHLDGYMDTVDAISSHQTTERKLEIMKDSHTGAFACMYCVLYFVISFAVLTAIYDSIFMTRIVYELVSICVISRALSGFIVVITPNARKAGMLDYMTKLKADKKTAIANILFLLMFMTAAFVYLALLNMQTFLVVLCVTLFWSLIYRIYMMKTLKGVTGDTSGFFLVVCELLGIVSIYVSSLF